MPSRINIGPENGPYVAINEEDGNLQLEDNSGNVVAEWDETNAQWDFANNTLNNVDALDSNSVNTEKVTIRWNADGDKSLQDVVDDAPENARIVGDLETQVVYGEEDLPIEIETDGLTLEYLNIKQEEYEVPDGFGPDEHLLWIKDADDVTIRNCWLDGSRPGDHEDDEMQSQNANIAVGYGEACDNITIENCWLKDPWAYGVGVNHEDTNHEFCSGITVQNVKTWGFGDDGITYHRVDGGVIDNCRMWGATDQTGNPFGVEIEWATHGVTVRDCIAWNNSIDHNNGGGYTVKDGGGNPAYDITFINCKAPEGNQRDYQMQWDDDENHDDPVENPTVQLIGCSGTSDGAENLQVRDYHATVLGGIYEHPDASVSIRVEEQFADPEEVRIRMSGYPTIREGYIRVEGGRYHRFNDIEMESMSTHRGILFEGCDDGWVEGFRAERGEIELRDGAGPIYFRGTFYSALDREIIVDGGTAVPKDATLILDLSGGGFEPEEGAQAYDSNSDEPAYGDGTDWRSMIDDSVIS